MSEGSRRFAQVDIDADDDRIRDGMDQVEQGCEIQDRPTPGDSGLDDEPRPEAGQEFVVDVEIKWTLLDLIAQERVPIPGKGLVIELMEGIDDLGGRQS